MTADPRFEKLAANAILIVGAPRSGTSWLGKIFDSHPDVLYRHEPDEGFQAGDSIPAAMASWVRRRDLRTAGKRPFFAKSWQTAPARMLRTSFVYAGAAAERIGLPGWPIPDLGAILQARAAIKSVRLSIGIGDFARAYPDGRAVLILRHPCGQVASIMRGARDHRFDLAQPGTDMPFDEASAIAFAARHGLNEATFQGLPDAVKYAWSWREFNETAVASIAGLRNARIVVYEALCTSPVAEARSILEFAGLPWHTQTGKFLARSTSYAGRAGYYAVVRNSIAAAEGWRTGLSPEDQDAVRAVVRTSPLLGYWPDLVVECDMAGLPDFAI
jgi:hypothetical protein